MPTPRQTLPSDPHRPLYHFLPPANWMNDPNGLIQWNGQYHLFYQYNPFEPVWGFIHWGHAVSDDLIHWRDLPLALSPDPRSPREDGCWTGCAVNDDGVPTLIYTEVQDHREMVFLATSRDELLSWQMDWRNPVIADPPPELKTTGFRDPYVWREGDEWRMVIGAGLTTTLEQLRQRGAALLYRSADLREWKYLGPLFCDDSGELGTIWECPNFFPLGDKHVLIVSTLGKAIYFVGDYAGDRFTPLHQGVIDYGGYFYAPQVFTDEQQRRIMFGWLWEGRSETAQRAAGWAGVMSLPRLLSLADDGALHYAPVPELQSLRGEHLYFDDRIFYPEELYSGNHLEITADFEPDQDRCGFRLCCSPDNSEETLVGYDGHSQTLFIDRRRASLSPEAQRNVQQALLQLARGEALHLHIFLDRSVVEVFANERCCLTSRMYPMQADSVGVRLYADSGTGRLRSLNLWKMQPIWPDER